MTKAKKQEQVLGYREQIEALLSNYVDGWDIFKKAPDWDYPVERVPGAEGKDIPNSWLELADKVISILAIEKYGLNTYPNVIEIISPEHMLDAYSSVGMPISYDHWSFGKQRVQEGKSYEKGHSGLAYEIVINTDPSISYCMAGNTKTMQMLVIAHAAYGHNSFFKNNHLFRQFTKADQILDDLQKLKDTVAECEEKYGIDEVEKLLDAAHALQSHAVYRTNRPKPRTPEEEAARRAALEEIRRENVDALYDSAAFKNKDLFDKAAKETVAPDMEENLLRYVAAYAPHLKEWQRDLLRQISDKAQYFYPQRQTQVMNEGWASFWHYTLMNELHEMDLIDDGMSLEFTMSHCGVLFQPEFDSPYFSGRFNPYALGFAIYQDLKRICENPTDEDRKWFPQYAGKEWLPTLKHAMEDFKDESFILQFLSPKVIRDFKMFQLHDDDWEDSRLIAAIHDEDSGYRSIRNALAASYRLSDIEPRIEVASYNFKGDRSLTLQHTMHNRVPLGEKNMAEVLRHFHYLWGHPVVLHSVDADGIIEDTMAVPETAAGRKLQPGDKMRYDI